MGLSRFREPEIWVPVVAVVFLGLLIAGGIKQNKHQEELISAGLCEKGETILYYPPPAMTCTSFDKDGICTTYLPLVQPPYYQSYWSCRDENKKVNFWRREE
jgi:hypothetical protein